MNGNPVTRLEAICIGLVFVIVCSTIVRLYDIKLNKQLEVSEEEEIQEAKQGASFSFPDYPVAEVIHLSEFPEHAQIRFSNDVVSCYSQIDLAEAKFVKMWIVKNGWALQYQNYSPYSMSSVYAREKNETD